MVTAIHPLSALSLLVALADPLSGPVTHPGRDPPPRRAEALSPPPPFPRRPAPPAPPPAPSIGSRVLRDRAGPRVLVPAVGSPREDSPWSDEDGPPVDARPAQRVGVTGGPAS